MASDLRWCAVKVRLTGAEEEDMAWIVERPRDFLVRWRDAETGKLKSLSFRWGPASTIPDSVGARLVTSKDQARAAAEGFRNEATRRERRSAHAYKRLPDLIEKQTGRPSEVLFGPDWDRQATFELYLQRIIDQDAELRETTREQYTISLRTHIQGTELGRMPTTLIEPELIREFWADLSRKGAGVGARRNVYLLLSKGFTRAVRDGIIGASPLARAGIKCPPKGRREEVVPLAVEEVERLAEAAARRNPRDRIAVLLMAYCGLRAGEVGGLRVQDVDFNRSRLTIRQQVVRTHKRKYVSPLKSRASRRTIEVAPSIAELKAFIAEHPPADDGRILHGNDGSLWAHSTINTAVGVAARRAGLRPVHSHALRHTAVSLLIDDGANPKAIQAFVGHATIGETLGTYGHLFDYGGSALAASMERRRTAYRGEQRDGSPVAV